MSSVPPSDSDSDRNSGSVLRLIGRIVRIVLVVIAVLAVKALRRSDPDSFLGIALILAALVGIGFAVPALIAEFRRDKPSIPVSVIKLLLGLLGAIIALFSVAAIWNDGTVADLPVGIFRFGYQGASAAFTSSALLGLSVCGMVSAAMNFAGRRLGWLRGLGLLIVVTVAGGFLAPDASNWQYRQLEANQWQQVAGSTDSFDWAGYSVHVPEPFQRPEYRAGYTWAYVNEGLHGNTELLRNTLNDLHLNAAQAAVPDWDRIFRAIVEWLPKATNPKTATDIQQSLLGAIDRNPFPPSIVALKELVKSSLPPSK